MTSSSLRYEDLKCDLMNLQDKVRERIKQNIDQGTLNDILSEGETILRSMQQEVKLCPISVKPEMESRLSIERREWQAFKEKSRRDLRSAGPSSYWSSNRAPGSSTSARLEGQLTEGVNILEKTNLSLMRATQVAQESEQIGTEVIGELGIQRENLLRTRERLTDADQDLKRTHVMIKSINRRLLTNKCLLIVIILMELGILMALIYIKFIHKKS